MSQLTLMLAATTCRLSDVLKAIREQEALIKALRAQGRPVEGAEELLACFKDTAAAIADQREHLERQILLLAQRTPDPNNGQATGNLIFQVYSSISSAFALLSGGIIGATSSNAPGPEPRDE